MFATKSLPWQLTLMFISVLQRALGNENQMRTPIVNYDSTFLKAPTYPFILG